MNPPPVNRIATRRTTIAICVAFALFLLQAGCGGDDQPDLGADPAEQARRQLIADGQNVYYTLCIACHNPDPALAGPQGPPVKGASAELLEAKIVRGTYPENYKPLQETQLMPVLEVLAPQVPALAAFLNQ